MINLRTILAEEGILKEAGKGIPKGKLTIEGAPYNFRQFNGQSWKGKTLKDFEKLDKIVSEGFEAFGAGQELPGDLESDIAALKDELTEKTKKFKATKRLSDSLKKEGIDPASLRGGYMFYATDEDGVEWEHQPDGWYQV